MEIDFHFAITYAVSRIAGFKHEEAATIATSAQYVDDTVDQGVLRFKSGEAYTRICTSHEIYDYHIYLPVDERRVWVPFHFIPGNDPSGPHKTEFFNRAVCRPNSKVAQAMNEACIRGPAADHSLHRLGITAHVFIDTWAHQGFAGIAHPINRVRNIQFIKPSTFMGSFKQFVWESGIGAVTSLLIQRLLTYLQDKIFPMGHGAALHYPDHPFRVWSYTNGHGVRIQRDNPKEFLIAADELCKFLRRYRLQDPSAVVEGLPKADYELIRDCIISFDAEDKNDRLKAWLDLIKKGRFSFGPADVSYEFDGPNGWCYKALGCNESDLAHKHDFKALPGFASSDWKLFHDAARSHQYTILYEVLPKFDLVIV